MKDLYLNSFRGEGGEGGGQFANRPNRAASVNLWSDRERRRGDSSIRPKERGERRLILH